MRPICTLERMASSTSLPHRQVVQARGLLLALLVWPTRRSRDGVGWIRTRCGAGVLGSPSRVSAGVGRIAKGRGRKSSLPPGTVEEVLRLTHKERPADGSTQWSTRTLAARVGIGKDAVAKIWADHNLKPWKVDTFKVSNDPRFEEKLVDVVGLYLNPPATGGGVQLRREDPVPGLGPHPAVAADEARAGRDDDP